MWHDATGPEEKYYEEECANQKEASLDFHGNGIN
jgi:hypothetical protein